MQRLIEIRYDKPLHHQLMKAADYSMLSEDVLVLIYHMAKICDGGILEIGSFLGASTVAAGLGVRASRREKGFISIEPGGALKDHKLATRNIFKDLTKHIARAGLANAVTLLNGSSFDQDIIASVKTRLAPGEVGLFIFDADANGPRAVWLGRSGGSRMFLPREFQQASFAHGASHSSAVTAYRLLRKYFGDPPNRTPCEELPPINPLTASQQLSLSQCWNTAPTTP